MLYQRILVATDGSETATEADEGAVALAKRAGARLSIFSVRPETKARQVVDQERRRFAGAGIEIDTRIGDGDPATVIPETADDGEFDLLVVGNKGMLASAGSSPAPSRTP